MLIIGEVGMSKPKLYKPKAENVKKLLEYLSKQKNDKTKPGYWSCRLPRYAKSLGLSGGGGQWW